MIIKRKRTCGGLRSNTFTLKNPKKYRQPVFLIRLTGTKTKKHMPSVVFLSTFFNSSLQNSIFDVFGGDILLLMILALLSGIQQMKKINLSLWHVEICIKSKKRIIYALTEETTW